MMESAVLQLYFVRLLFQNQKCINTYVFFHSRLRLGIKE